MRTQRVHPTDNKGIKKKASDKIVAVKLKIHFAVVFRSPRLELFRGRTLEELPPTKRAGGFSEGLAEQKRHT